MSGSAVKVKAILRVVGLTLVGALAGCANQDPKKLNDDSRAAANNATSMVQKKGAAIVVRVLYAGHYCHQGQVRLQKIVDGRTSTTSFVEIGQQTGRYGADGLKFFAETAVKMATINLKWLSKEVA